MLLINKKYTMNKLSMKVKSTFFRTLLAAAAMLVMAPDGAKAQSMSFTISNGTAQWLQSESGEPFELCYGFDGSPMKGSSSISTSGLTYDLRGGASYLRLNTAGEGSVSVSGTFDKYCIWHISDNPGYCYQQHEVGGTLYRYYLRGTTEGVAVWKVVYNEPVSTATLWNLAEGGMYIDQSYVRYGVMYTDYRWLAFSGSSPVMSCAAEHRPEARVYVNAANTSKSWYCPNISTGSSAASAAFVNLPVQVIDNDANIARPQGTNLVLDSIQLDNTTPMTVGDATTVTVDYSDVSSYQYTQPYREVTRFSRLKGVNYSISATGDNYIYDQNGVATTATHYFYSDDDYTASHSTPPAAVAKSVPATSTHTYEWSIDNASIRYLTISDPTAANPTIRCVAIPAPIVTGSGYGDYTATLTLRVTNSDGVTETDFVNIKISTDPHHTILTESVNSVFIGGDVFGGGRMADVEGATDVLVINCDTISRVYGGNDITGTVTGGSTVTIGNNSSNDYIGINSVYGAGNGFYSYGGTSAPFTTCQTPVAAGTDIRLWGDNSGDVIATTAIATNAPLIYITRVFINSPWARLDTVFGGARNADVLPLDPNITDYATADHYLTDVTVNAGTVYAVFGGNNVGGCLNAPADTINNLTRSRVTINMTNIQGVTPAQAVAGTGTPSWATDTAVINSYYTKFGREWGIRYVFGGGNKVTSALRSDVFVNGGMMDTVFAGGNEASVFRANATVNCTGDSMIYHNYWTQVPDWRTNGATLATKWVGTRGSYNIRALFGGNNRAAMACVPDLLLKSGGLAVVYGGGNAGDMINEVTNIASNTHHYRQGHVDAIIHAKAEFNEAKNKQVPPAAALGTFIHVVGNSKDVWIDYIYGGCRAANVTHATMVHLERGNVGAVFGGCNISGNVGWAKPDLQAHIGARGRGGTYVALDDSITVYNNIYGGSNGYYHCVNDEHAAAARYVPTIQFEDNQGTPFDIFNEHLGLTRPTHNYTHVVMNGGKVYGNVYGGGNHATVGFFNNTYGYPTPAGEASAAATPKVGGVHLSLVKGEVFGNVFGGSNMATVYGLSYFYIGDKPNIAPSNDGGHMVIHGDVYGGNDRLGNVGNNVNIPFVDAAGTELKASDNSELNTGGKAAYNTYILVEGTPQISRLFGGGNGAYDYDGEHPEYPAIQAYCANNTATQNPSGAPVLASAFVDVHTAKGARIDTLFGGGNAVDVQDRVMVLVNTQQHLFDESALNDPDRTDVTIGTIFGGNNVASMGCVPTIELKKGVVHTVFGGGNMGHMMGATNAITDLCDNPVLSVASFVHVNSEESTVSGSIFGGCNKADVHGKAYVLIEKTSSHGVDTVYGGNDVSGRITGNTRVDVYGGKVGTIYGGSNGFYDYEMLSPGDYRVRTFAHNTHTGTILYDNSIGSPFVDETKVNIFGGTVEHNIYGGGRMGDCRLTNVYINDRTDDTLGIAGCRGASPSTIKGFVYGGGEGDTARLDIAHRGNVTEATNVQLYHASSVIAYAYGGGKGGDVYNSNITSYPTWDESFERIFGGCWGADLTGTARLTLNANMAVLAKRPNMYTAHKVYGGNDFSGNCYRSELTINSGRYDTLYGAGCGNYPASAYTVGTSTATASRNLFVPNNEEVVVTFNGTDSTIHVKGELYGGGQMGTTMRYVKNAQGQYIDAGSNVITSAAQEKVADTNTTVANAHTDPLKYAYIILNIHAGKFDRDIFSGAQGKEGLNQLVYGLKILNMDGGYVTQSVYGGSQSVSDGYSKLECNDNNGNDGVIDVTSTMRPSSILNLMGGTVENHVYGAGFKGFTYGSVYVNVGKHAIDSSTVWRTAYGPAGNRIPNAYTIFKPGKTSGLSDTLTFGEPLLLAASVYAGANWGQNDGSYTFEGDGFYGGESRILIDGRGYADDHVAIDIANSVLGAGTSVLGGDMLSRIDIRNYGGIFDCGAAKQLKAIQRADALYLQNTGIIFTGTPDASSALYSPDYAINKVDTVNAVGFNLIEIEAPKANIEVMRFFEDVADQTCYDYITYPAAGSCLVPATLTALENTGTSVCTPSGNQDFHCDKIGRIDSLSNKHTAILMNNGVTIDIQEADGDFGEITGYAYLIAQDGTKPTVRARIKNRRTNPNDGGFSETCNDDNATDGMRFTAYGTTYRYWSPGGGKSKRQVVLLAHANPHLLPDTNKAIKVTGTDGVERRLSLSHTTITLPPSSRNNFYKLGLSGIKISEENDVMQLIDVSWNPVNWTTPHDDSWQTLEDNSTGAWFYPTAVATSSQDNFLKETYISNDVNTIFGLVLAAGEGFTGTNATTLSPSTHTTTLADYTTGPVSNNNVSPVLDLYLTYDSTLFNSILGMVKFVLVEYSSDGTPTGDSIEVEAFVSTIINDFKDMEFDLIATSNEGASNTFLRRGILPATLKTQDLYIQSVKWYPTNPGLERSVPYEGTENNKFQLSGDREVGGYILTDSDDGDVINANKYRFGVSVQPIENTSSSTTSDVGWYRIDNSNADVYRLVYPNASDKIGRRTNNSTTSNQNDYPHAPATAVNPLLPSEVAFSDLTAGGTNRGTQLGVLDGRGLAGLNFELFYDGRVANDYPGYFIGDVVLEMASYVTGNPSATPNKFKITLHVKVRPGTDTIYIASVDRVSRPGLTPFNYQAYVDLNDGVTGKSPKHYIKTFEEAMGLWKPNTVICVLDSVVIGSGKSSFVSSGSNDDTVKIIRYDGHHHDAPCDEGVYRGPMIIVENGGYLELSNVTLQGGAVSMRRYAADANAPDSDTARMDARTSKSHLVADTNYAHGPIFNIRNGGHVQFKRSVTVEENWNDYRGGFPSHRGGAISVVDGGILSLSHDVVIRNNFATNTKAATGHCDNGAVFVDGGIVRHSLTVENTAIKLIDNYLIDASSTGGNVKTDFIFWKSVWTDTEKTSLFEWAIDTAKVATLPKANLFLTRKASGAKGQGFISNGMPLSTQSVLTPTSRIGISKWFPGEPGNTLGEPLRDTVYFAYQEDATTPNMPNTLIQNNVFSSDEGYNIRYSHGVNEQLIYLTRCATFRHQSVGEYVDDAIAYHDANNSQAPYRDFRRIIQEKPTLEFVGDPYATCPNGNDSLIYRVSHGMLPYRYVWTDNNKVMNNVIVDATTPATSKEMWEGYYWTYVNSVGTDAEATAYQPLKQTFENGVALPYLRLPMDNTPQEIDYTVSATDAFGCVLSKRIKITFQKDLALDTLRNSFKKTYDVAASRPASDTLHWTDSNSYRYDNTVIASGERLFRGVKIDAFAWPDRNYNLIHASNTDYLFAQKPGTDPHIDLNTTSFCEGDIINLRADGEGTTGCDGKYKFSMWDFDPYYGVNTTSLQSNYVVPKEDARVIAYYSPTTYWKELTHVSRDGIQAPDINHVYSNTYFTPARNDVDALTTYNDDLHIYTEKGLAWFLKQVNGLDDLQLRQFYFNKVFIHQKADGTPYDMKCHRWTPVGSAQYPFRGWVYGVAADNGTYADTTPLPVGQHVVIKNIIVDEPYMSHVGFFGHLDTARVQGLRFEAAFIRGAHDAGVLAARSKNARITDVMIVDSNETFPQAKAQPGPVAGAATPTTLIMTHNNSGGLIGYSEGDSVRNVSVSAKYVGDAVYSGGVYGYAKGSSVINSQVRNYNRMNGVYLGGVAGYYDATPASGGLFRRKSGGRPGYVANNFVQLVTPGSSSRVGGIVGYAENAVIENNYVHGRVEGSFVDGGLAAQMGNNTRGMHNYYASDAAKMVVGSTAGSANLGDNSNFAGSGNAVTLGQRVYGVDNLTRVLNIWVREQNAAGGDFKTWTSDLRRVNHGYPLFGRPDLIPVSSSTTLEGCEQVEWMGVLYRDDTVIVERYIDTTQMIDSTMSTRIRVHHASYTQYADSAYVGEEYMGYGFYVSAAESELLRRTLDSAGIATLVLSDTLQSANGCDSIVLLTLTFSATKGVVDVSTTPEVKVYPNPTTSTVNVAAEGMTHVEVYDNEGRRLQDYTAQGQPVVTLDVRHLATGVYYLRIHTPSGVTIQKVIKR